ncbi:MAG: ABC transporter ATP-binding protein/permease [Oscillospiraceae bacterium]|nr:ABC transporter ATP-binding protein/permease [Oscillospiraceae bacterium]
MSSKKTASPHNLRRALREAQTLPWMFLFIFVFCLMSVRDLLFATALGGMVENALQGDMGSLRSYLYYLGGAAFLSVPLQLAVAYLDGRFGVWSTRNLFLRMFPPLGRIPEALFEKGNTATLQSRMTDDINRVQSFFHSEISYIIWTCAYGLVPLIYLITISPVLALVSYGVLPLFFWAIQKVLKPLTPMTSAYSAAQADALTLAQESITQVETVKSYNLDEAIVAQYQAAQQKALGLFTQRRRREAIAGSINHITYLVPTFLIVMVGVWLMQQGSLSVAGLIIFIQVSGSAQIFISSLSEMLSWLRAANGHLSRIYEAVDTPPERQGGDMPVPDADPILAFDNVHFGYEGRDGVLKGFSFALKRGETVGIVGPSGCGKSTLFKMIEGFYLPEEGALRAFDRDMSAVDLYALRQQFAFVPQDPFFLSGTLRENLLLGQEGVADAQLLDTLRVAGIGDVAALWPEGLDMQVAERGANLSGGQRQRIAIARALLRGAQVLLFDEVTSALDYETEREIYQAIGALQKQHTILIVSHRLSIVRGADRILVLNEGRVAEQGSHEALLAQGGLYAHLYAIEDEGRGQSHA